MKHSQLRNNQPLDFQSIWNFLTESISASTVEQLTPIIKDIVAEHLSQSKTLCDTNALCEELSLSKSTIIKLRKQGLPVIRIGESVRFNIQEVKQFLLTNNSNHDDK